MASIPQPPPPNVNRAIPLVPFADIFSCAVAFVAVSVRAYTRFWIKRAAGWDDYLIIAAVFFSIAYLAAEMIQCYDGQYGRHVYYLSKDQVVVVVQTNIAVNILNPVALALTRASICIFLLRLIGSVKIWRRLIWAANVLNVCVAVGTIIMYGINCIPASKAWNQLFDPKTPGWCVNPKVFDDVVKLFSALNCVVDFMCATIPFAALRDVQLDKRTKLGLFAILGCGLITAACSIGRVSALDFSNPDPTYELVPLSYWVAGEMYGAIVFASLPAMRQLWSHTRQFKTVLRPSKAMYTSGNSHYSNSGRTKQAFTPAATRSTAQSYGHTVQGTANNEIGQQTDLYVELNDLEHGNRATTMTQELAPGPAPPYGSTERLANTSNGVSEEYMPKAHLGDR